MQFAEALNIVLKHEGGYANVPGDRGGETYQGISRKNWPAWPGWQIIDQYKPLKNNQVINNTALTNVVSVFYKNNFWDAIKAEQLPASLRALTFDFAINSGTGTAIKTLQKVLKDSTGAPIAIDGKIGAQTLKLINQVPQKELFEDYKKARILFFTNIVRNNPGQSKFLKGWLTRVNSFQFAGVAIGATLLITLLAYFALKN